MRTLMLMRSIFLVLGAAFVGSLFGLTTTDMIVSTPAAFAAAWKFVVQPFSLVVLLYAFALRTLRYPYRAWRNSVIVCGALLVWWVTTGILVLRLASSKGPDLARLPFSAAQAVLWSFSWPTLSITEGATLWSLISGTCFVILAMYYGTRLGLRWRERRNGDLDEIMRHEAMLKKSVRAR